MLTAEQLMASNKTNLTNLYGLTNEAFAGIEKLVELNLTAARAALTETADHAQAILSAKDAQELLALQAAALQPLAEKAAAYNRHVYDIASNTGASISKSIENKATETQQALMGYVDAALKNAPVGSESAVTLFKQAVSAGNNALESVQKAVKQATEIAESNIQSVTDTAVKAAKSATTAKKR